MPEPLAPFDADILASVAGSHDVTEHQLREALKTLHAHVESFSGVEELVHDWRKGLPYDPLVTRTAETYYLVFLPTVWEEFAEQLDWKETTLEAVRAVHERQARRAARRRGNTVDPYEGAAPLVISR